MIVVRRERPDYSKPPPWWRWWWWHVANVGDLFVGSISWEMDRPIRRASDLGHIDRSELRWRLIRNDTSGLPDECYGPL